MTRFLILTISFYFTLLSGINAQSNPKASQYQSILHKAVLDGLPAISVLIKPDNGKLWKGVAGLNNIEDNTAIDPEISFRLASITKLFTAVVILDLADKGKIELNKPISNYLNNDISALIPNHQEISVLHLLSHSSGIFSFTENNKFWHKAFLEDGMSRAWKGEELIKFIEKKKPVSTPQKPFSKFMYSNSNYILLGLMIEKITAKSLVNAYKEVIFNPLKMTHTFFEGHQPHENKIIDSYAIPDAYFIKSAKNKLKIPSVRKDKLINLSKQYKLFNSWAWAAGGISSNPSDLYTFIHTLKNGKLLSESSQEIFDKIYSSEDNGTTFYGGSGGSKGIQTTMLYLKPQNLFIIILINSTGHKNIELGTVFRQLIKVATNKK